MPTPLLTSLCAAKTYLQIADTDTSRDRVINQLIPQVSARIQKWCGRTFGTFEYTEYYSGDGTPVLALRNRPVHVDLRVWVSEDGYWGQHAVRLRPGDLFPDQTSFPLDSELPLGAYALDIDEGVSVSNSGLLYRVNAVWPQLKARLWLNQSPDLAADYRFPSGNIKVVYTAGDLPEDVMLAANMTIAAILQSNVHGAPIASESYEDYSYSLTSNVTSSGLNAEIPPQALSILASYRELAW